MVSTSAARPAASPAWIPAGLAAVAFLALPFGRPGRPFLTFDPALRPYQLGSVWVWLVLALAIAALVISLLPLKISRRGEFLALTGLLGVASGSAG